MELKSIVFAGGDLLLGILAICLQVKRREIKFLHTQTV